MHDDPLAAAVAAQMAQDDEALDPRIEQLLLGQLSAQERAALEAEAAQDPRIAEALALAAPLSPSTQAAIRASARPHPASVAPSAASVAPPAPRARRRRPAVFGAVGVLVAAAAVLLVLQRPSPSLAPLPHYEVQARIQDAAWRGSEGERVETLRADSELTLVLRPETPIQGEAEASLWVLGPGGAHASPVAAEWSEDGAVRWVGTGRAITGLTEGSVQLVAIVQREGAEVDAARAAREGAGAGWQAAVLRVELRSAGGAP